MGIEPTSEPAKDKDALPHLHTDKVRHIVDVIVMGGMVLIQKNYYLNRSARDAFRSYNLAYSAHQHKVHASSP